MLFQHDIACRYICFLLQGRRPLQISPIVPYMPLGATLPNVLSRAGKCPVCRREVYNVKRHMVRHTGLRQYQCGICGKRFGKGDNLKVHMRTHTGEKPYTCDFCGMAFTTNGNLKSHRRVHTTVTDAQDTSLQ